MKILDVRTIPLSYRCKKPYMSAAGGQGARNTLDIKGSADSSAITLVASMHLLASMPNGLLLEFDQSPNALRAELLQKPIKAEDGFVKLPERLGLGVERDPAVIERYRVR
jgi:L-alanine-DL-glutamate epimerase-like enolase superfamily enzyme